MYKLKIAAVLVSLSASAVIADVYDELMPRVRHVERGESAQTLIDKSLPGWYRLTIRDGKIAAIEGDEAGERYARVTFSQLEKLADGGTVPNAVITDWPSLRYRGFLTDCGRNYQTIESLKDIVDHLAAYKYNVFHWHIVDNHGWRLESKAHPELQCEKSFQRSNRYYTQEEFKDIVRYAKARGIMVIPELDMPGHTAAFRRAYGIERLDAPFVRGVMEELIDELCSLVPAEDMPIIHLGTDETRANEKVPQEWLDGWAAKVIANGREVMGWSPGLKLKGQSIRHLWRRDGDYRPSDLPYIDSMNSYYINHIDPLELLSAAAYQKPCKWGTTEQGLGAEICVWHDDAIADNEDVVRMNAVYPALTLFSDALWYGREKDERDLYGKLPPPDDSRFALAEDLERRTLVQKEKVLKDLTHPFPFAAQTWMRWRLTVDGKVVAENIPGGTIYPRHFWYGGYVDKNDGVAILETTIESDKEKDVDAWIDMTGFSRSEGRCNDGPTPKLGEWNKHGATIEINGEKILPPRWAQPGLRGRQVENPLIDQGYIYRPPTKIHFKKGTNRIKLTLPKRGGWKWIGTFLPLDS